MKEIKNNKKKFIPSQYWIYKLTSTSVYIMFCFCIMLFLFYFMGNYQNFMDRTQIVILTALSISTVLEAVLSFMGLIELGVSIFLGKFKSKRVLSLLSMMIIFVISIVLLIYSVIVKKISTGV